MLMASKKEEVIQRLEITESTWLRWNRQFGGMISDDAKRLRELEFENERLIELFAKPRWTSGS